ncbi:DUF3443 family protein [Robbsia sp. Bb-Pol-6]|uniref:DUF3443 family protein n=1 Tax=Robbsia betulipollinis TaxID=2981849 RepID=A0ABT3ZID3_9BURK|nr:DUF3443 family protein [Robbsia betulipollinis]
MKLRPYLVAALAALSLAACGGGSSSSSSTSSGNSSTSSGSTTTTAAASNVATITVGTPVSGRRPNLPYVSVTICVPGTTTCQTIDDVIVDTGSVGLRLLASAVTLSLPAVTTSSGQTLGECVQFANSYSWGAVRSASYTIGGETTTSSTPVHIIGDTTVPTMPTQCSANGGTAQNTISTFGANGLLGIGQFQQDCGSGCTILANGNFYYACTGSTCTAITLPLASQLQHPATLFSTDNNGTVVVMPSVAASGAASASGQLIFGIGTESNNAIGSATVINSDASGNFTATYDGLTRASSFIDSGSNGLFFNDANDTSLTACSTTSGAYGFYCPSATINKTVTLVGNANTTQTTSVALTINSATTLLAGGSSTNNALPGLAGKGNSLSFDFGLPFFYGRSVYTGIQNVSTPAGTGPFVAF